MALIIRYVKMYIKKRYKNVYLLKKNQFKVSILKNNYTEGAKIIFEETICIFTVKELLSFVL